MFAQGDKPPEGVGGCLGRDTCLVQAVATRPSSCHRPPGSRGGGLSNASIRGISFIAGEGPGPGSHIRSEMGPSSLDSQSLVGEGDARHQQMGDLTSQAVFVAASAEASPSSFMPLPWLGRNRVCLPSRAPRGHPWTRLGDLAASGLALEADSGFAGAQQPL